MRKVKASIEIKATPKKALSAFTNPKMLNGWWGVERHLIELKPGGVYSLVWKISESGIGYVSTGIISEYIDNKRLYIQNFVYFNPEKSILGPMSLLIEVKEKENLTELSICQDGYQEGGDWNWYYNAVSEAWPKALELIKEYIESNN